MIRRIILVVDDSPLTLDAMRRGLVSAGFVVRAVSDLADLPKTLHNTDLDLILMDVEMAEAFGDDLAMLLRDDAPAPPIYLLSALPEEELAERATAAGVDGYLPKHAGVDEVVRRVVAILGAQPTGVTRDLRTELKARFVDSARLRTRHARGALDGGRDGLRQVAYELHALVGEAAILGFTELAALAQDGRHAIARCLDAGDDPAACAAILAAIDDGVSALAEAPGGADRPAAVRRSGLGHRVLLVDDSEVFRATLGAILEDSGYLVSHAGSVAEGRALLAGTWGDVVILDLELGDGSGAELMAQARAALPQAVLVVLSGGDARALPATADLLLHKTLDPTTLLVKLERAIVARRA